MMRDINTLDKKWERYPELAAMFAKRHRGPEMPWLHSHNTHLRDANDKHIPFPGIRMALSFLRGLEQSKVVVRPEELIVGVHPCTEEDIWATGEWQGGTVPFLGGITAHMGIEFDPLLHRGLRGIRAELQERLNRLLGGQSPLHTTDLDNRAAAIGPEMFAREDFLRAGLITLDATVEFQRRYAEEARRVGAKSADVVAAVPAGPATTFHEALQSIYFVLMLCTYDAGLMGIGRLDQVLWPYYQNDLRAGRLSQDRAVELLGAFYIKTSELIHVPMSIMLAGRTRDGKPATNELTYLMLRTADLVRLHNPSIGLAVDEDTPDDLLLHAARMVTSGYGHPAFFNDRVITQGLIDLGVRPEHARWHLHCTCTEMTTCGSSGIWVVADYINFGRALEWLTGRPRDNSPDSAAPAGWAGSFVHDVPATNAPPPEAFTDFEQVKTQVKRYLAHLVRENVRLMNQWAISRQAQSAFPFLSLFVNDCIEKETDLERGGAKYYFFYPQLVGVPTAVDSLLAVKKIVFEEKRMDFAAYARIVRDNFADAADLRDYIRRQLPKYGTNDPEADALAREIMEFYFGEIAKYTNPYGARYAPGFLSWIMHGELGKATAATPDGRLAGQALSDSLAAVQGMAKKGPTAMLETVEKFDLSRAIGAVVVNVTIPVAEPDEKMVHAVKDLIRTHFARGGFELQFNVMSKERLIEARQDPDRHRDVLVRVGGYSDYFVNLSTEIQDEILRRFE